MDTWRFLVARSFFCFSCCFLFRTICRKSVDGEYESDLADILVF